MFREQLFCVLTSRHLVVIVIMSLLFSEHIKQDVSLSVSAALFNGATYNSRRRARQILPRVIFISSGEYFPAFLELLRCNLP